MIIRYGIFTTLLLAGSLAYAGGSFPAHQGSSPWDFTIFSEPSSTYVVNDTDGNNDRFLFRSQGPIRLTISIRRYVGETNGDGKLLNISDLVTRGIIANNFVLRLPAFDVDEGVVPIFDCDGDDIDDTLLEEIDTVSFNDEIIDTLRGANGVWQAQSYELDIEKLKFPDAPGGVGTNIVEIEIDTGNKDVVLSSGAVGCQVWATEIDWASIQFEAADPVVLVHGINSSGAAFENFEIGLGANRVISDASIDLTDQAAPDPIPQGCPNIPYNNSTIHSAGQLRTNMKRIAEQYGVESINIAAHSKGGIDSRAFLDGTISTPLPVQVGTMGGQPVKQDLEANSIVTLNTPHRGSVLADYGIEARQLSWTQAIRAGLNAAAAKGFEGSYYCDLSTARANQAIANTNLPNGVSSGSVATDADFDNNGVIEGAEGAGFTGGAFAENKLYQLVANTASVSITITERNFLPDTITVTETPTAAPLPNDAVVTVQSASEYTTYNIDNAHHLNVTSEANGATIARDAQGSGVVDWRAK